MRNTETYQGKCWRRVLRDEAATAGGEGHCQYRTESGLNDIRRPEDAMYIDARDWNVDERVSNELAASLKLMQEVTM